MGFSRLGLDLRGCHHSAGCRCAVPPLGGGDGSGSMLLAGILPCRASPHLSRHQSRLIESAAPLSCSPPARERRRPPVPPAPLHSFSSGAVSALQGPRATCSPPSEAPARVQANRALQQPTAAADRHHRLELQPGSGPHPAGRLQPGRCRRCHCRCRQQRAPDRASVQRGAAPQRPLLHTCQDGPAAEAAAAALPGAAGAAASSAASRCGAAAGAPLAWGAAGRSWRPGSACDRHVSAAGRGRRRGASHA